MPKKVREIIKLLESDGWTLVKRSGTNHRKFRHATKPGHVVVSGNPGHDMAVGTFKNILRQAGIEDD
jgi:predicted RNA binding protein YcfA (HicA-like mRNA interferase family)